MKAVIFIESKEEGIQFKCDTFWSRSDMPRHAKVYSDDDPKSLKSWLQSVLPHSIYKDRMEWARDRYNGVKLGYFTPDISLYENDYILKEGVTIEQLGNPNYLWVIKMNDISDWIIKGEDDGRVDVDPNSLGEFVDYRQTHRDELIQEILKEKESD